MERMNQDKLEMKKITHRFGNLKEENILNKIIIIHKNEGLDINDFLFKNVEEEIEQYKVEFKECQFINCTIKGKIEKSFFTNVLFENCDLSNISFNECIFSKVTFKNCKLIGDFFIETKINNVYFEECNMKYCNFTMSRIKDVVFDNIILDNTYFNEVKFDNIKFEKCSLTSSEFFKTKLKGIDLSNSEIDGLSTTLEELKGLSVNQIQALELSKLLGIIIK